MDILNKILSAVNGKLVIILMILGVSVRIFHFGAIPPGLNQDEASIGYEAYSILNYGVDRNGFHNPVYLTSWGSGQNALYAYLSMPFIYLFGLNPASVRVVNLLFGTISLLIFYLVAKKIFNRQVALLSLFLLAISPWHIMMSRWALESNLFPAFFLIAVFLMTLSLENKRFILPSLIFFALSFYTYATAFFVVPVFLSIVFLYFFYHKKINFNNVKFGIMIFVIISLPIFMFLVVNYFKTSINAFLFSIPKLTDLHRFNVASLLFSDNYNFINIFRDNPHEFFDKPYRNLTTFIKMIINQNDEKLYSSIPKYGWLYLFSTPFLFIGFLKLISENILKTKEFKKSFIILSWITTSFLLGSLLDFTHFYRVNIIFIPLISLVALGIYWTIQNSKKYFILPLTSPLTLTFIVIIYLILFSMFSVYYFSIYPKIMGQVFFESFGEAINYASAKTDGKIYVTNQVNMPYIYVLFYRKISPETFKEQVKYYNPGDAFQEVESFDRYRFGIGEINKLDNSIYVIHNSEEGKFSPNDFIFKRFKYYSVVSAK